MRLILFLFVIECTGTVWKDVSVWITALKGFHSFTQHIISGRLQVISSLKIKWHPKALVWKKKENKHRYQFVRESAPIKCLTWWPQAVIRLMHAGGVCRRACCYCCAEEVNCSRAGMGEKWQAVRVDEKQGGLEWGQDCGCQAVHWESRPHR